MESIKYEDLQSPIYDIKPTNYENIFNIHEDEKGLYYYNLLKKIDFPEDLNNNVYSYYETKPKDSYHLIAYQFYKSPNLWWLICAVNNIDDPTNLPASGTILKILNQEYVNQVVSTINTNQ